MRLETSLMGRSLVHSVHGPRFDPHYLKKIVLLQIKHPRETSQKSLSDSYQEASLYNGKFITQERCQQPFPAHEVHDLQLVMLLMALYACLCVSSQGKERE